MDAASAPPALVLLSVPFLPITPTVPPHAEGVAHGAALGGPRHTGLAWWAAQVGGSNRRDAPDRPGQLCAWMKLRTCG
ncbi:hypothetical protein MRA01_57440 [Methylobacterium radiotolerans]|nr:hypothetical protein MRA01_57440 [Methylobacterium radiotolerans]